MTLSLHVRRSALYVVGAMVAVGANSERAIADVVGPGALTASASLSGTFGPGPHNAASNLYAWDDFLFANAGINDPAYRVLFSVVLQGSNPTSLTGGTTQVNSRGILDFVTLTNLISSEIVVTDPQFTRQTITYSMPLYMPGSPINGSLTEFRLMLQGIASANVVSGSAQGSTSSDFAAFISSIRAVDGQGNDITQQIGLRTASGFMGSAPEPGTLVFMASGLFLIPLTSTRFRKRFMNRSV
jgi:hypothetical protein